MSLDVMTALGSVITALASAGAVFIASRALIESSRNHRATAALEQARNRAYLVIDADGSEIGSQGILLRIRNVGQLPANHVEFVNDAVYWVAGQTDTPRFLASFQMGSDTVAPNHFIIVYLTHQFALVVSSIFRTLVEARGRSWLFVFTLMGGCVVWPRSGG